MSDQVPMDQLLHLKHAIASKTDQHGMINYVSPSFCQISEYDEHELIGQHHNVINSKIHSADFFKELWSTIQSGQVWHGDICNRAKSGRLYWVRQTIIPLMDLSGQVTEYMSLITDITKEIQIQNILEIDRIVAEKASQSKSEFLANMSHEIRTPLNAMLGLTQLLERTPLSNEQHGLVQRIVSAGEVLLRNLNDVLDFSKIESGKMSLQPRDFSLNRVVNNLYHIQRDVAKTKGLTLTLDIPSEKFYLFGDDIRLSQILLNLISNAIKFTLQGSISISLALLQKTGSEYRFRFQVADTGVGISPQQIKSLFQPFTQLDSRTSQRFDGTGLGLSICKSLIDLMGGTIGASGVEGEGSVFWFEIPLQAAKTAHGPEETTSNGNQRHLSNKRRPHDLSGQHILVVDDNEMNRYMVQRVLHLEGAQTSVAVNGEEALHLLSVKSESFDVVLMDVQMPVMDGLEATRRIRSELGLTHIPIVICSAGVQSQDFELAMGAGASDFVSKPINLDTLAQTIHQVCTRNTHSQEIYPRIITEQTDLPKKTPALWTAIPGLDGIRVYHQLDGDIDSYQLMLELFLKELEDACAVLPAKLHLADPSPALNRLHKLRGAAGSLCANDLVETCTNLENILRNSDIDITALPRCLDLTLQTMLDLTISIKTGLGNPSNRY